LATKYLASANEGENKKNRNKYLLQTIEAAWKLDIEMSDEACSVCILLCVYLYIHSISREKAKLQHRSIAQSKAGYL
ncbi:hypothetical protein, partial [Alteromonas sp. C1M14]|uniref:hypothetical protein n=1 Tax=Alteromonas sp. C1M14 TaxID=2841567 RepID=UPI001C085C9C